MDQRCSASAVKEVLRDGRVGDKIELSAVVGRDVAAIEVREQIDGSTVIRAVRVQDAWDQHTIAWLIAKSAGNDRGPRRTRTWV